MCAGLDLDSNAASKKNKKDKMKTKKKKREEISYLRFSFQLLLEWMCRDDLPYFT